MAVQPAPKQKIPGKVNTKIVGTTFEGRQGILAAAAQHQIELLFLEREPDNPHDPDAIKVMAPVYNGEELVNKVQLGYISNSDRMCIVCGKMVDGSTFSRSRSAKCPECGKTSQFAKHGMNECPDCHRVFDTTIHKTIACPTCFGDEWARDGLATLIARAMESGVQYACRVDRDPDGKLMYTGGPDPETGRSKSRGCNIRIERLEITKPV